MDSIAWLVSEGKIDLFKFTEENTDLFSRVNKDNIKTLEIDYYNDVYALTNDRMLYTTRDEEVLNNVDCLHFIDFLTGFAITLDRKIICLNSVNFDNYFGDTSYDKVLVYLFGIVALKDGCVKIALNFNETCAICSENLIGVEDIKIEDDVVYVFKDGDWQSLFIEY